MANTTEDKLNLLKQSKTDMFNAIKNKLEPQGESIPENTPLSDYDVFIKKIKSTIDTSDATATSGDILDSKTAYVNGQKITGTIPNNGDIVITPDVVPQIIPEGYISSGLIDAVALQAKTVNPSTSQQTVNPDSEYLGLSRVTVNPVTASIDSDIQSGNIKAGVNILGVDGKQSVVDTFDATAVADDIIKDKTAYVNGSKVNGSMYVEYNEVSNGMELKDITGGNTSPKIFCINTTYNLAITISAQYTKVATVYDFTNNQFGSVLDSFTITSGDNIAEAKFSFGLNNHGNLNVFFINRRGRENYSAQCLEFNVNTKRFLTNTLATYTENTAWWHYAVHANPNNPAHFIVTNKDNVDSFVRSFVYQNYTLTRPSYFSGNGFSALLDAHFNEQGTYFLCFGDSKTSVYSISSGGTLTRVINKVSDITKPTLWRTYYLDGSSLYNISGRSYVKSFGSLFSITTSDWSYTYKDYLVVIKNYTSNPVLNVFYLNPSTLEATQVIRNVGITFSPVRNWGGDANNNNFTGSPYYPQSNATEYILNINTNIGYKLEPLAVQYIPQKIIHKNATLVNAEDTTAIASNILSGKTAFNSTGRITGTMANNGMRYVTPSASTQTLPSGYYSMLRIYGDSDLVSDNIKNGVNIFGVTGTYQGIDTSDADAVAINIRKDKTAYVNGSKITGTLPVIVYPVDPSDTSTTHNWNYQFTAGTAGYTTTREGTDYLVGTSQIAGNDEPDSWMFEGNRKMKLGIPFSVAASIIGLTSNKIKKDEVVLGVTGTYEGSSSIIEEKDVNFYDYDGVLLYSYSASDFVNLTALPSNPSHTGLTAQGWNWTLSDAKTYVSTYGKLNIGQMYVTDDGKTRIYIHLEDGRLEPYLGFMARGTISVDWRRWKYSGYSKYNK